MTKDEIIEMANKAFDESSVTDAEVICFAKLITEKEREAFAKLCDLAMLQNQEAINELKDEHIAQCFVQGAMHQLVKTSKAIRAMKQE